MEAKEFVLKRWTIMKSRSSVDDTCLLVGWGNAFQNPRFYEGRIIHTSQIKELILEEDSLLMITTHSKYRCALVDCFVSDYETKEILCEKFPEETKRFEAMFQGAVKIEDDEKENPFRRGDMMVELDLGTIRHDTIENKSYIVCVDRRVKYFYVAVLLKNENGELENLNIEPRCNLGMFQDSVLCSDHKIGFDYCYFPAPAYIRSYSTRRKQGYALVVLNTGDGNIKVENVTLATGDVYQYPPELSDEV